MTGTLINVITVLLGGSVGLLFGAQLPERLRATVMAGLGLFTVAFGMSLFLETDNALIAVGSLLFGAVLGEWLDIEGRLRAVGSWLEKRFTRREEPQAPGTDFVRGFLTASVLFCVGPMTILGSIQDGLTGDYQLLAVKSTLDGFASLALASALGVGVMFSSLVVLVYQGSISLLAAQAQAVLTEPMMAEMTAVGGIIIIGLGIGSLLELRPIRTGNLLPALILAPLIVWLIDSLAPLARSLGIG